MKKRYLADLILFIASMIWGLGYFFQKAASETTAPLTFNCLRYLIAAMFLGCLARFRYPRGEGLKYAILTGIVMSCAGNAQQIGMQTASIGNSSFITAIYIVLVPFLSALILHRKIKHRHYLAALLSLIGLFLITTAGKGLERISAGDMIVFIGSIFWALQILCVDKAVTLCDPVSFTATQFLTAAVLQFIVWFTIGQRDLTGLAQSWPYALASGMLVLGLAFTMQAYGQKNTGETEASIIMGLESVFGALFGILLYHESFAPVQLIGMVLIFSAVLLVVLKE
ncbi:MAG: DMT family transporter [Flexilinea sp.]|nr:DMT family transporter [Flexilinea sp.]